MKKTIKFTLKPKSYEVEKLIRKCSNFLKSNGILDDTVQSQVMVVRELVKNGLKYGVVNKLENWITVQIHINKSQIVVEVMNPINETNLHKLKELDETIQWIRGYQDPYQAYILRLKEASGKSINGKANGLNLARIAYKANAILDFFVSEDNILNLLAVRNLDSDCRN